MLLALGGKRGQQIANVSKPNKRPPYDRLQVLISGMINASSVQLPPGGPRQRLAFLISGQAAAAESVEEALIPTALILGA